MKLILLLFALFGVSCALPHYRQSRSLRDDFDRIEALIPVDQIKDIYMKYREDPDIVKVVAYLKSKDFAAVAHIVAGVPEVQDMVNYLEGKGLKPIEYLNKLADLLGLPHWPGSFRGQSRTWQNMIDEVLAVLPMDKLQEVALDLLMNSEDFQELFQKIQDLPYQKLHDNALKHPEIVDMLKRLNAMGVDTKKIWETICGLLGWNPEGFALRQSRSLRDDFDRLEALIPVEKIKAIYMKYREDPDIVKVVAYLKSKDFAAVAHIVAGVPEVQDMVNYLEGKGLRVTEELNKIADLLGLPHWPGTFRGQSRTWQNMIDEMLAEIPMDQIQEVALDLLMNSEDFQELFQKIQDLPYQKLHDNALKHPEIVDMLDRANAMGLDTKKIWETICGLLGWNPQ